MTTNTILNLPKELDYEVRTYFSIIDLSITSIVCKAWKELNEKIYKTFLQINFSSFSVFENFPLRNQCLFLQKLDAVGFPMEIIKIVGKFYQFKHFPPILGKKIKLWTRTDEFSMRKFLSPELMKFPIMAGRDENNFPFIAFKLKSLVARHWVEVFGSKEWEESVLVCLNTWNGWRFELEYSSLIRKLELVYDKKKGFYPYKENIKKIEEIMDNSIKEVKLVLEDK